MLLTIVGMTAILTLLVVGATLLAGCSPDPAETGWTLVGHTPGSHTEDARGIYKMHDSKEKVTFYATRTYGDYWVISAVKD